MSQLDKLTQEDLEKAALIDFYEKVAFEAGVQKQMPLTDEEKAELAMYLLSELEQGQVEGADQTQAVAPVAPQAAMQPTQTPTQVPAQPIQPTAPQTAQPTVTQPVSQMPVEEQFQQKVAETLYHSEMFGRNAARAYWDEMAKLAAEASEEEPEKDEKGKAPAFEMMAKERASKMKEEMQKKASYEDALNKRALEMIQSGQV